MLVFTKIEVFQGLEHLVFVRYAVLSRLYIFFIKKKSISSSNISIAALIECMYFSIF